MAGKVNLVVVEATAAEDTEQAGDWPAILAGLAAHDFATTAGEAILLAVGATAVEDTERVAHCPTRPAGSPGHKAATAGATGVGDTEKAGRWVAIPAVLVKNRLVRIGFDGDPWR